MSFSENVASISCLYWEITSYTVYIATSPIQIMFGSNMYDSIFTRFESSQSHIPLWVTNIVWIFNFVSLCDVFFANLFWFNAVVSSRNHPVEANSYNSNVAKIKIFLWGNWPFDVRMRVINQSIIMCPTVLLTDLDNYHVINRTEEQLTCHSTYRATITFIY